MLLGYPFAEAGCDSGVAFLSHLQATVNSAVYTHNERPLNSRPLNTSTDSPYALVDRMLTPLVAFGVDPDLRLLHNLVHENPGLLHIMCLKGVSLHSS